MKHPFRSPLAARRRGISVMEALIAVGVASIGLLGVIALLPLAAHQSRKAKIQDQAAQAGRNAFREVAVRRMLDPANWRQARENGISRPINVANNELTNFRGVIVPGVFPALDPFGQPVGPTLSYRRSFCIDPRFFAEQRALGGLTDGEFSFPYVPPAPFTTTLPSGFGLIRMERISLASSPVAGSSFMSLAQANTVFLSDDDLAFERVASDRTLMPRQLNDQGGDWDPAAALASATPNDERLRQASGDISWFATLTPVARADASADMYTLSVVVFYKRDTLIDDMNERVVEVDFFPGGGIGGGDITLIAQTAAVANTPDLLEVRRGDWVLLSRLQAPVVVPGVGTVPRAPLQRWYRVAAADSKNDTAAAPFLGGYAVGDPIRHVTLTGADWPVGGAALPTQAAIVRNVIAVFEKTVRLGGNSPWRS